GAGERRGVVDTIARHRDSPALRLQARDQIRFLLRPYLAVDLIDAELASYRLRGGRSISRSHDNSNACLMQRSDCTGCGVLDRIVYGEQSGKATIDSQIDHARAFRP